MKDSVRLALGVSVAALVGIAGALFLAGPALFADGSDDERMAVVAILAALLGLAGLGLGSLAPNAKRILPAFLAGPTLLISVGLAALENNILVVALLLGAVAIGFSVGGVFLGARLRGRRPDASRQTKTP